MGYRYWYLGTRNQCLGSVALPGTDPGIRIRTSDYWIRIREAKNMRILRIRIPNTATNNIKTIETLKNVNFDLNYGCFLSNSLYSSLKLCSCAAKVRKDEPKDESVHLSCA
jgi:hypothetical protein